MKCFTILTTTIFMVAGVSADFCTDYTTTCGSIAAWSSCATDYASINAGKGDKSADTQACRLYHLGLAKKSANDAKVHCPHASKNGDNVCVDNAANFCARYTATCGSISAWSSCAADFAKFTEGVGTTSADTQACRLYHLSVAETSASNAKVHCPHASKAGGGVCVASAALSASNFCARFGPTCKTSGATFANCGTEFPNINAGKGDKNANTQACRIYHLGVAQTSAANAKVHCPHAGTTGGGVCIDNAANFCARYTATCGSISAWSSCAADFAKFTKGAGTTSADTQACRLYHVSVAETSASNAKVHCPHASKAGGGVCVVPPSTTSTISEATTFSAHASIIVATMLFMMV